MSFERVDGGQVRSVREAKLAVHEIRCPNCGKGLTMLRGVRDADAMGYAVHVRSRHCGNEYDVVFEPGPGWERRPPEIGIEIAATDDPSTVIPESKFAWYFDQSMANLAEIEPAPSDPDRRIVWEDMARILARDAIGMALEVGKLARAAKRELPAEMTRAIPWLRSILEDPHVLAKGTTPP